LKRIDRPKTPHFLFFVVYQSIGTMRNRTTQLSILLVMKHAEFRRALIVALRLIDPAITIAGESGNCTEALDLFRIVAPSLVLMDATLRPIPFSEMTARMLAFDSATRIIGVTNVFVVDVYIDEIAQRVLIVEEMLAQFRVRRS